MSDRFAALAEGTFSGMYINSLGKAGLDGNGNKKMDACYSLESAKERAIHAMLNRLKSRRDGCSMWRPTLQKLNPERYHTLVREVKENVEWTYHLPSDSYRAQFRDEDLAGILGEI